jgi:hypothetical protein
MGIEIFFTLKKCFKYARMAYSGNFKLNHQTSNIIKS